MIPPGEFFPTPHIPVAGLIVSPQRTGTNLWEVAAKELAQEEIEYLKRDYSKGQTWKMILISLERETERKKEEWESQRWQIQRANKPPIIVRDKIDRILFWVTKFIQIGDIAIQYDPGHASLPWAAIRLVLQVSFCALYPGLVSSWL